MVPPVTVRSPCAKSVDASVRLIVNVAVSPTFNEETSEAIVIVGAVVSITKALLSAKEPEAPGDAKVRVALFPAASLIVPLFNVSADVEAKSRSLAVSPA